LLKQVWLFAGLDESLLAGLAARMQRHIFPAGTSIFHEGQEGETLHIVESGRVRIFLPSGGGEEVTVDLGPDVLGELVLLDDDPQWASAEALEPTVVYTLSRDEVRREMARNPQLAAAVMGHLSPYLRRLTERATHLTFLERLARILLETEADWRRRFRAAGLSLPVWARDEPERLLYRSDAGGKWENYGWDRRTNTHRQVTNRPTGTMSATLDPTGEWIWWFDDERGNEFGRWMVEPFAGGERRTPAPDLPPAYRTGLAVARGFAIIGSSTRQGTSVHLVSPGQPAKLLYTHRDFARVEGLSRNETLVCISHSEHGDSRHRALRVLDLEGKPLADLWDGPGRGLWVSDWSPVEGDQRLLVAHERRDRLQPLLWNVSTGDVFDLALELPGEIEPSWYPDASALLLLHHDRGRAELYRFDLSGGALGRIDVEPGTISQGLVRPDGEIWYEWTRSSTPPQVRADGRVLLTPAREPAPGGVAYSDHTVDGVHIFLAEPVGPRPHPTIFHIHDGPHAHDRDAFSPTVQTWVDHGFTVVLVNYRGSSGYGRAWRDAITGNPGFIELEDISKVHDWVIASGIADPQRVVLAGRSWGGYLTLLGLGMQPERWSLGIAGVPVADTIAGYEDEMEPLKATDRALFGGSPEEVPDVYRLRSPITYVERVRVPVLITAGENDPRCPIRQIENYVARLRALRKPHEVYRYGAGHSSMVIEETIRQMEVQIAFAARHLGTSAPL